MALHILSIFPRGRSIAFHVCNSYKVLQPLIRIPPSCLIKRIQSLRIYQMPSPLIFLCSSIPIPSPDISSFRSLLHLDVVQIWIRCLAVKVVVTQCHHLIRSQVDAADKISNILKLNALWHKQTFILLRHNLKWATLKKTSSHAISTWLSSLRKDQCFKHRTTWGVQWGPLSSTNPWTLITDVSHIYNGLLQLTAPRFPTILSR